MSAIEMRAVSHAFDPVPPGRWVLQDIALDASAGSFLAVVGPTGCGKTTLLRILSGHLIPTSGYVTLDGASIEGPSPLVAVVSQRPGLLPWRTIRGNLQLAELGRQDGSHEYDVGAALAVAGLDGRLDAYPPELSVGMQQVAMVSAALTLGSAVIAMDEPFASLDALSREQLGWVLLRLWRDHRPTIVFVTHSLNEAVSLATEVVVLAGSPASILDRIDLGDHLSRPTERYVARLRELLHQHVQLFEEQASA